MPKARVPYEEAYTCQNLELVVPLYSLVMHIGRSASIIDGFVQNIWIIEIGSLSEQES